MKHENGKQIKAGALLGYINYGVKTVIQLAYVPILLRMLGQAEYGVYQLVASVISYLSLLNFGFGGSYLRFYSQCKGNKKKEDSLNGSYLIVFTAFALIAFVAGMILTNNTEAVLGNKLTNEELSLAHILVFIMSINMAISFPISVFSSIVMSRERFVFQRIVELFKTIFNPVLVILVLFLGYGSVGLVCVSTLLTIISALMNIWYVQRRLRVGFDFKNFDIALMKQVGVFSFFIFINSIIDQINWNVDKFLLGRFVGSISIAIYSVGAHINTIFIQITDMLATVVAPRVNKIVANDKNPIPKLNDLWIKVGRFQAMIVLAVISGFIIYGKDFVLLWAGPDYAEAYYITLLLIVPIAIPLCQTLGVDIQRAMNKHQYRTYVYAGVAIMNLIISIPLIKSFGAIGAASGTTIAIVVGNIIIMNYMYGKLIGLDVKRFWKNIGLLVPTVIPPTVISITIKMFFIVSGWGGLAVHCLIFGMVYLISLYLYGFNSEEKEMLRSFKRLKRK